MKLLFYKGTALYIILWKYTCSASFTIRFNYYNSDSTTQMSIKYILLANLPETPLKEDYHSILNKRHGTKFHLSSCVKCKVWD